MSLIVQTTYPLAVESEIPPPYTPLVGNSLWTQGLCFAQVYTGGHGRTIQGLLDGYKGTLASAVTWRGPLMDCTGGASPVISYGSNPQTQDIAMGAFSIFARVQPGSTFNTASGIVRRNDGNTVNAGWQLTCNSSSTRVDFVRAVADLTVITSTGIPTTGWHTVGVAYPNDLVAANMKIYHDGVVQTHGTDTNGSGAQGTDSAQAFIVGESNFSTGAGTFKGVIDCLYIWKRYLRQEEFMLLQANPYAPFQSTINKASAMPIVLANPVVGSTFPGLFFAI